MTASSLPSTLVKCLYLFFDLPDPKLTEGSTDEKSADGSEAQLIADQNNSNLTGQTDTSTTPSSDSSVRDENAANSEQAEQNAMDITSFDQRQLLQRVFVQVSEKLLSF